MSVEVVWHEKVVTDLKTGETKVIKKKETIWHMPDGLPDELPPAQTMDNEACMRLVGVMLRGEYEALRAYYYDRRRKVWHKEGRLIDAARVKARTERAIHRLEAFFLHSPLCEMVDGKMVIEQCRAEVYGKEWREHPDFNEKSHR